jgi:starvation-inducible outer membrane lipoprotein
MAAVRPMKTHQMKTARWLIFCTFILLCSGCSSKPTSISNGMKLQDAIAAMQSRGLQPQQMGYSGSHAAFDLRDGRTIVVKGDKTVDAIEIIANRNEPKAERLTEAVACFDF